MAVLAMVALAGCGAGNGTRRAAATQGGVALQSVPGMPFGVVATKDGYGFVDLSSERKPGVGRLLVYSLRGPAPRLIRTIPLPGAAVGNSLTRDGRLLLVADGAQGATVVSVSRAEDGAAQPVLGTLAPPASAHLTSQGAIETASSANGRYVFVSLEYGRPVGAIAVYDLGSGAAPRVAPDDYVGAIPLGQGVVGSALSPDGRYLYVTSELAAGSHSMEGDGTLSVISVAAAEHHPAAAVLRSVAAMNQPVRVAASPDGSTVWVTARGSDRLLAFSARELRTDPSRALLASVKVGTAPVGVALFDHGRRVLVCDSDRFEVRGKTASLTVVNGVSAVAGKPSVMATLPAGSFPREIAVEASDRAALVSDFGSDQLETVDLSSFL